MPQHAAPDFWDCWWVFEACRSAANFSWGPLLLGRVGFTIPFWCAPIQPGVFSHEPYGLDTPRGLWLQSTPFRGCGPHSGGKCSHNPRSFWLWPEHCRGNAATWFMVTMKCQR